MSPKLENSERVNGNQNIHIVENKEKDINSNYSHQTNIPSTHSPTYKSIAVQLKTSHHVSTINNNKHHCSPRNNNSTRNYNNTGSNKPVRNVNNTKEKSKIGIKYSIKKCIEDRKTVNGTGKDQTKIQIIMEKKSAPENIFPIKNKQQRRNTCKLHKCSTIKEISKKSKHASSQKGRSTNHIIPSNDPT